MQPFVDPGQLRQVKLGEVGEDELEQDLVREHEKGVLAQRGVCLEMIGGVGRHSMLEE